MKGGCDVLWLCIGEFRGRTIKAFVRYAVTRYNEKQRDLAYRIYVTDALKYVANINERFYDAVYRERDNRTGDEIANDIIERAGLVVSEE